MNDTSTNFPENQRPGASSQPESGVPVMTSNPDCSSAQVVPGSVVSGNALYLGICVARILAKMVLPELTPGEHSGKI